MAIKLKDQPRHVLLGLARKHWNSVSGYFSEEVTKAGPKGVKKVSSAVLRQALKHNGIGV